MNESIYTDCRLLFPLIPKQYQKGLRQNGVGKKGGYAGWWMAGGEIEEKSCKCSLKTVKKKCNLILYEDILNI